MDPQNVLKTRQCMQITIFSKLQKWKPSPSDDAKYMVAAKRLEEGLFRLASTKEDYLDPSTLESRLTSLIKARKPNNYNQIQQNANSSSLGTTTTPEVSIETAMDKEKKLVENGDQWETEIAEYLNSLSLYAAQDYQNRFFRNVFITYVTRKDKFIFEPML